MSAHYPHYFNCCRSMNQKPKHKPKKSRKKKKTAKFEPVQLSKYMKDKVKDGAVSAVSGKKIKMKMKKTRKEKQVRIEHSVSVGILNDEASYKSLVFRQLQTDFHNSNLTTKTISKCSQIQRKV